MKRIWYILICLEAYCQMCYSQTGFEKIYDDFLKASLQEYLSFSDSVNNAFAETLRTEWDCFQIQSGISDDIVHKPESVPSMFENDSVGMSDGTLPIHPVSANSTAYQAGDVMLWQADGKYPLPVSNVSIDFYGTTLNLRIPEGVMSRHLLGIRENDVADFWRVMTEAGMGMLSDRCRVLGDSLQMNDWGILQMVLGLSKQIYPRNINSEQTVLSVYLLNQLGLNARIARYGHSLTCLVPARQKIYGMRHVRIDSEPFYLVQKPSESDKIYTYRQNFPLQVKPVDLTVSRMRISGNAADVKHVTRYFATIDSRVELTVNNAVASFYAGYPHTDLKIYAGTPLTTEFDKAVVERIRPAFDGKTEVEAVNLLLRMMQYDFNYMTDEHQFGYEKPFFLEENLIYPYNDCEDRAVFFSYLVRNILGLETALVIYPGHVCAGVCFTQKIQGMSVAYSDRIYTICDPTCQGAPAGATNRHLTSDKYEVVVL